MVVGRPMGGSSLEAQPARITSARQLHYHPCPSSRLHAAAQRLGGQHVVFERQGGVGVQELLPVSKRMESSWVG